jgi:hypothetical protein
MHAGVRFTLLVLMLAPPKGLEAQRGNGAIVLSPPRVRASSTPLTVSLSWAPVDGAASYTAEVSTSPTGPWTPLPMRTNATEVTTPSFNASQNPSGMLYYYRVTALPSLGEPGVTVVPWVTPNILNPLGLHVWQDGADLLVSWAPARHASSYLVTAALGQQLPPTHSVEVGAQYAETRLPNVALGITTEIWVTVKARYAPTGALSSGEATRGYVVPLQMCWPTGPIPGPVPSASVTVNGPTRVSLTTQKVSNTIGRVRAERAPMGSQQWIGIGCQAGELVDKNLTPGTAYQYRVSEISPSGTVGQTMIAATTTPTPDSPTPTATLVACGVKSTCVRLDWLHVTGADNYRLESSYGAYLDQLDEWPGSLSTTPAGMSLATIIRTPPSGVHTFYITPLFPSFRPGPKPPGQVTVVVP